MDITKIKEFRDAKFTIKNMKRQPTEKKKITADHIPGKELASLTYKKLYNSIVKKTNNPANKSKGSQLTLL